jgi:hypothetical protein
VLWRTSLSRVQGVDVVPRLPESCDATSPVRSTTEENQSVVQQWSVQCDAPLTGATLAIDGLDHSVINVIVRIEAQDGSVTSALLAPGNSSYQVPAAAASPPVFSQYLKLGVEHLLLGFDHVLFVLGLMLLVRRLKPLVITVTCFTLGHSVTLSLATLGLVQVNPAFTEFGIALSILVLACEIARALPDLPPLAGEEMGGGIFRHPGMMSAAFGLLHGLGFAGALSEIGLPPAEIPLSLFAFNLGIELGQLLLVALALLAWLVAKCIASVQTGQPAARMAMVYLIGSLAAYWCFERIAVLFS